MRLRTLGLAMVALLLTIILGCGPSFIVQRTTSVDYPVSKDVALVFAKPTQPYIILATFKGFESGLCRARPYCSLYPQAEALGAQVIWVIHKEIQTRPEQWVEIQGRMTRIPSSAYERLEGAFLRFTGH